ncbi:MAG TPA: hypothetical protein ENG98_04965 [Actinobacteria bacterium]|nr:hypothetical protein BMS3Bbin02_00287 [bacterium BMS3Bbin02]HDL42346.1 hypothetical protein [Actinomycetota bacterium]
MAELDVDAFLARFEERARAVKDRGVPPIEGDARRVFIDRMKVDYMDYALVGAAQWSLEDDHLVLRIPLSE